MSCCLRLVLDFTYSSSALSVGSIVYSFLTLNGFIVFFLILVLFAISFCSNLNYKYASFAPMTLETWLEYANISADYWVELCFERAAPLPLFSL